MLVEGKWVERRKNEDSDGRFVRPETTFRNWIEPGGEFAPEARRYHLYVSLACPWAHRVLIMRKLKGLEEHIGLSVVDPYMGDEGWAFSNAPGAIPDPIHQAQFMRDVYLAADPKFTGRVTVPVLWDKKKSTIVNNESRELLRMLDLNFDELAQHKITFCPESLRSAIDAAIDDIYQPINNGVYRSGFATSQAAYEEGVTELFRKLDEYEEKLGKSRYVCGDVITEADWCLFTTLVRFDPVYHGHFKCNLRRIYDYPNLWNYLKDLYQYRNVAETVNLDHIKQHYYRSHESVNPTRIVPLGPEIDYAAPHDRARLGDGGP